MTLSYHTLDTAAYEDLRYDHIKVAEGVKPRAYLDTARPLIPTIGFGFNLRDPDVRDTVLESFGFRNA